MCLLNRVDKWTSCWYAWNFWNKMFLPHLWGPSLRLNSKELLSFTKICRPARLFPSALALESLWGTKHDAFVWRTCSAIWAALVPRQIQRRSSNIERQIESNSNGRKIGGWAHAGLRGTFCTAMCSFLLESQSVSGSPIINTLPLSINAMKWDWGELAKPPPPLAQRLHQSKLTPTTHRSHQEPRRRCQELVCWVWAVPSHSPNVSAGSCSSHVGMCCLLATASRMLPAGCWQLADWSPGISDGGGGGGALPGLHSLWKWPVENDLCFPRK